MAMAYAWTGMAVVSLLFGILTGNTAEVGAAAMEGATQAVELTMALAGPILLWSGLMEVMERSGLTGAMSRALRPVLERLFPSSRTDAQLGEALSCNVSANLLGLGNAATPAGIRAARRLHHPGAESASDELCRLVVLNTASVQLLPTTVAAVRAACGSAAAFDILPAVWLASACSVTVGLLAERGLRRWF